MKKSKSGHHTERCSSGGMMLAWFRERGNSCDAAVKSHGGVCECACACICMLQGVKQRRRTTILGVRSQLLPQYVSVYVHARARRACMCVCVVRLAGMCVTTTLCRLPRPLIRPHHHHHHHHRHHLPHKTHLELEAEVDWEQLVPRRTAVQWFPFREKVESEKKEGGVRGERGRRGRRCSKNRAAEGRRGLREGGGWMNAHVDRHRD